MQHGALDQQLGDLVVAVLRRGQLGQVPHGVEVLPPLLVDQCDRIGQTRLRCEGELHEELVPYPGLLGGVLEPGQHGLASGVRQLVRALVGASRLFDVLALDEAALLQPSEGDVDLADVGLRVRGAQELLKVLLQLVTVRRATGEERKERQPHSLPLLPAP